MQAFKTLNGLVAPLDRPNVDTDAIIPKQYLKSIERVGFGEVLFDEWRYLERGKPGDDHSLRALNKEFVLNQKRYHGAEILLARENFGCGSSREHAPWALQQYGFKVIVAPSFADIFYNNAFKNGILLITLASHIIDQLFAEVADNESYRLTVDLSKQIIIKPDACEIRFDVESYRAYKLLNGLDDIGITLQYIDDIRAYEQRRKAETPWLF